MNAYSRIAAVVVVLVSFTVAARTAAIAQVPPTTQPTTAPSLTIDGEFVKPITLDATAFAKLPHVEVNVKDHSGKPAVYRGVPLRTILLNAGVPLGQHRMRGKMLSYYLVAESADGYKVVFALPEFDEEFAERSILIVDERDGSPLTGNEGPLRIIAPQEQLQARWARMVIALHVKHDQ